MERKFKIDDAVGAVAIHGYCGFLGVVMAGFLLWAYPSSPYEGFAPITPWGQLAGAIIMFFVLGFVPCFGPPGWQRGPASYGFRPKSKSPAWIT